MWFWGIYIPNCYGSGTTRARGAPHGDGREGVFGSLTALWRSFGAPVSVSSARDRQRRSAASRTEMPRRTRGSLLPLRFARALVFDCAASLRKLRFTTAHFASRATPSPPIPQLRLVQGRRNAALWASRFADSEVGRMGRVRRVGQWFPEICFESFATDLATPSARCFAHESESQNAMQPARSFRAGFSHTGGTTSSLPVWRRIGQRGRCPSQCEGESRAAGTLPLPNFQGFASASNL